MPPVLSVRQRCAGCKYLFQELDKVRAKGNYAQYRDRCAFFLDNPPAKDWDGVFIHETK